MFNTGAPLQYIYNTTFACNIAAEGRGPAVSSSETIGDMSNVTFHGNSFFCARGYYAFNADRTDQEVKLL